MVKYLISHKNPDTDAICSSIVYSELLSEKGIENKAIKLGNINNETAFILSKFNFKEPQTTTSLEDGSEVILMDHNEAKQSINNIENLIISQIIDHHKFAIQTGNPLFIRAEPIGSTCSIVAKLFEENKIELTKELASLLVSGIISDTLYFRSPTTTNEDKEIVQRLNKIAQIDDLEAYSLEMFNAKSDLGDIDVEELIKLDYKVFEFAGKNYGIGVMETTSPQYGLDRKDEIIPKLKEIKSKDNLEGIFFSIIDILNEKNTTMFADESDKELLVKIFDAKVEDNLADLGNIVSRKKQVVPQFEKHLA